MTQDEINKRNVFSLDGNDEVNFEPDFEIPDSSDELVSELVYEQVSFAVAAAGKLYDILTSQQRADLTPYQRAGLEFFSEACADTGLGDDFAEALNKHFVRV